MGCSPFRDASPSAGACSSAVSHLPSLSPASGLRCVASDVMPRGRQRQVLIAKHVAGMRDKSMSAGEESRN